jgi:tellurite methyltransferase
MLHPKLNVLEVSLAPRCSNAVWIPIAELAARTMELPPKHETIRVADTGPEAHQAIALLTQIGRQAILVKAEEGAPQPGRLWEPNPFLLEILPQLQPGKALDLACGSGRDAVAMAAYGWEVTAFDSLSDSLEMGRAFAERTLGPNNIHWLQRDLIYQGLPQGKWDLITMFFFLDRPTLRKCPEHLNTGGSMVVETFLEEHRRLFGKPQRESLVLMPNELPQLLLGTEVITYQEGMLRNRFTACLWSRLVKAEG